MYIVLKEENKNTWEGLAVYATWIGFLLYHFIKFLIVIVAVLIL